MSDETKRVTLAYPHPIDAPEFTVGDTIELPVGEADTLIRDGRAREADKGARLTTKTTRAETSEKE